jgi:hypothetical protein
LERSKLPALVFQFNDTTHYAPYSLYSPELISILRPLGWGYLYSTWTWVADLTLLVA